MQQDKTSAFPLRILLLASCVAILAYGNHTPSQLHKVPAELATLVIAGIVLGPQAYWPLAHLSQLVSRRHRIPRLPYHYLAMVITDVLAACAWCAAIGVLAYWDARVVYTPGGDDTVEWRACHGGKSKETLVTPGGLSDELVITWCEVVVGGRRRLIGNGSARVQLHGLIGLAAASLFLNGLVLTWTLLVGKVHGIYPWKTKCKSIA